MISGGSLDNIHPCVHLEEMEEMLLSAKEAEGE